jgi:hypothetical protein
MVGLLSPHGQSRRSMVLGASSIPLLTASCSNSSNTQVLDFSERADRFEALVKMRACADDRVVFGGVKGFYYGVVNSEITPLYGVLAGTMAQYNVDFDTRRIIGTTFEVAYFTDWKTGKLLETFRNPFTDTIVDVPQTRMGPSKIVLDDGGRIGLSENPALGGFTINHRFIGPVNENGQVNLIEESIVKTPDNHSGPEFRYSKPHNCIS